MRNYKGLLRFARNDTENPYVIAGHKVPLSLRGALATKQSQGQSLRCDREP